MAELRTFDPKAETPSHGDKAGIDQLSPESFCRLSTGSLSRFGPALLALDMAMIISAVRAVCSIAGNSAGQRVPTRVNRDQQARSSAGPCGRRVVIGRSVRP